MGTLSKAFGVLGGVLAGKRRIMEYVRQRARPLLLSTSIPAADTAACLAAIDILESSTELVDRLWENARYFKAGMKRLGFNTGNSATPITPVMLGEATLAKTFPTGCLSMGSLPRLLAIPLCRAGRRASV